MTKLSVNINKIATLRNSRRGNTPNVVAVAKDIQDFGAHGITVHPRPDERHIKYQDVYDLKSIINTEFNIEGNPIDKFMDLVLAVKPTQVTLVPDAEDAITSNSGWDVITHKNYLKDIVNTLKYNGVRVSIFLDPDPKMVKEAIHIGADRIELYTESYAKNYLVANQQAIANYIECAKIAHSLNIGVNAGHDLSLDNIAYFCSKVPNLLEVSIGHALISEALYFGLENVIGMYLNKL